MSDRPLPLFDPVDRIQQAGHSVFSLGNSLIFLGEPITAVEAKHEAIARVERNANQEWRDAFRRALEVSAREHLRFTADHIWEVFERDYPHPETHEPRAAGAVVVRAIKDEVIVTVKNMFWNSTRRSCHNRPIQVYQSLIFR